MKFIDALYKYELITRDGVETYHLDDNTVIRTKLDGFICEEVQIEELPRLLTYDDWREYSHEAIPRVPEGDLYYYLSSTMEVLHSRDYRTDCDRDFCESANYFTNREDAQHLANTFKRLSLIINTKRYDTERDINSIIQEIDREYPILKRDIDDYNKEHIL